MRRSFTMPIQLFQLISTNGHATPQQMEMMGVKVFQDVPSVCIRIERARWMDGERVLDAILEDAEDFCE